MSRWIEAFENHPFHQIWGHIKQITEGLEVDDKSIPANLQEIARFKKVVKILDGLIDASDPELVPQGTWQNFHQEAQRCHQQLSAYESNRNVSHVQQANAHLDNLLSYVKPYVVESGKAARNAKNAFSEYTRVINSSLTSMLSQAKKQLGDIKEIREDSNARNDEIIAYEGQIKRFYDECFQGDESGESLQSKFDNFESHLSSLQHQFEEYAEKLFEVEGSIREKIDQAKASSEEDSTAISELLEDANTKLKQLMKFHTEVMGVVGEEGERVGGLKAEIEDRQEELTKFKKQQQEKYKTLLVEIESLLPSATSAGLAAAYRAMRKSFSRPIKRYDKLFYISTIILAVIAFISSIDSFWTANEVIKFVDVSDWKVLLSNMAFKLPIILPVVWLAIFATKRRSEYIRLQQEYSHKEALAKSYQSFKDQIDVLEDDKKEALLEKLLEAAITAVANNASNTLDGRHKAETPAHEILEKFANGLQKVNVATTSKVN